MKPNHQIPTASSTSGSASTTGSGCVAWLYTGMAPLGGRGTSAGRGVNGSRCPH
ncbi:hypothetical protein BDU57DRAFT_517756 [Ampelomyces quisqualis]|uniref:Uncharacterized protein n=1 Tax=Ampelomyces quisqualis TaxID=50730 RepID=A0A6A5QN59_AMPQU|nr:hypothetical protein BDU57DRAFT_517756 [Ampelomyces quisqualis]